MTVSEIVARPTEAVQRLFQQTGCPSATDADWGVVDYFKEAIAALGDSEIPSLSTETVERLPHHSLVRFHGMVQDLLNPEYYVGAFQKPNGEWVTTKFSDPDMPELGNYNSDGQQAVWERRPVVCVPIPGLGKWTLPNVGRGGDAKALQSADLTVAAMASDDPLADQFPVQAQASGRAAKRERSSDADAQLNADAEHASGGEWASPASEPQLDQEDSIQDTDLAGDQGPAHEAAVAAPSAEATEEGSTRPRVRRREDRAGISAACAGTATVNVDSGSCEAAAAPIGARDQTEGPTSQLPLLTGAGGSGAEEPQSVPSEVPGSCMVYLYDNAPAVVLHEVVEIIGILSHVPQFAAMEYEDPLLERDLASLEISGGGGAAISATEQMAGRGPGAVNASGERLAFEAIRAAHPPTSKVMRLHAVIVRRSPPLVPPSVETATATTATATRIGRGPADSAADPLEPTLARPIVMALRDRALGLLRWALGGDAVAAEYVLLQLLGRVTTRGDPAALGQLTMNLCRCPGSAPGTSPSAPSPANYSSPPLAAERLGRGPGPLCATLHAAISCLVPLSVALPLTVESCNGLSWAPQRDPVRERTRPSPLQLAPGTVTLVDETLMAPGQLKAEGVVSMQALAAVCRQQELLYDFETFQHPVPVDIPLIILTEGRSLLRDSVHVRVPLNATQPFPTAEEVLRAIARGTLHVSTATVADNTDSADTNVNSAAVQAGGSATTTSVPATADGGTRNPAAATAELAAVRCFLAAARSTEGYGLADGVTAMLEQYFVDARRPEAGGGNAGPNAGANSEAAAGGLTAEEFHTKLTLARLLALSHGERQLTRERWQQLLQLEHTREARLRVMS